MEKVKCPFCSGSGHTTKQLIDDSGCWAYQIDCWRCGGHGFLYVKKFENGTYALCQEKDVISYEQTS